MEIIELPQDVLQAIMLRLPFESLVECLSVCKKWRRVVRDGAFKEEYLRHSKGRLLFLYDEESGEPPERLFQSVSQDEPSLLSSKRQLRLKSEEELEMVSQPQQGLVCFSLENQFLLCNLGTKKCNMLVANAYKVICFDLESERFSLNDLPDGLQVNPIVDYLVKYHGKVCLVKDGCFESEDGARGYQFFVKEENEDRLKPLFVAIPRWREVAGNLRGVRFIGTSSEGDLVFATQSVHFTGSHYLLYYNAETQHLRKFKVEGGSYGDVDTFLDHNDTLLLT